GELVSAWIFQCGQIFDAQNIAHDRRIHHMAGALRDTALHWFHNKATRANGVNNAFQDLQAFVNDITAAFQPSNYQQILRNQLHSLQQRNDIHTYVSSFRTIIGQITTMADLDQVSNFIQGLKPVMHIEVSYRKLANLKEAITIAIDYDTAQ